MIVLSFDLDSRRRPVAKFFASPTAPRLIALEAAGESSPRPVEINALVDTGAGRSFVQRSILKRLDLDSLGTDLIYYHSSTTGAIPRMARLFAIQLFFAGVPGGQLAADLEVGEAEDLSGLGVDMLLGRDVLDRCLLIFGGSEGRFTIAFGPEPAR